MMPGRFRIIYSSTSQLSPMILCPLFLERGFLNLLVSSLSWPLWGQLVPVSWGEPPPSVERCWEQLPSQGNVSPATRIASEPHHLLSPPGLRLFPPPPLEISHLHESPLCPIFSAHSG